MATEVYKTKIISLMDDTKIELSPLKIKYLRKFMLEFENVKIANGDLEAISALSVCARICMEQYKTEISVSQEVFEEYINLDMIYSILEFAAGVKINKDSEEEVKKQAVDSGSTWDDLDLAKLESEVFLLGIWKDYAELENSLSMPELVLTLSSARDLDYQEKKFLAAMQGVDLDKNKNEKNAWEEMKARVFSGGKATDANDILAYQGINAQKAGFGIGMGMDYERID
jgi:hypothetical protein